MKRFLTTTGAVLAAGAILAGCTSSSHTRVSASPSGQGAVASAQQTTTPLPASLSTGSAKQQITATIVAFYRSTWQDDAPLTCALFSPTGLQGFMKASEVSFPDSVLPSSSCVHAVQVSNASLASSVEQDEENGPSIPGSILDNVGVGGISIHGNTATAIAPENVSIFIVAKRILLVHLNGRWLISGSQSLSRNLPQLLGSAKAKGELTPKRHAR
ncbi:MAG TPA: hypothetical protein VHX88_06675 [Solirubrobacteraceae bacterium]|nr:hypothetical protein [Solirubrobacteraceae bacterium]